MKKFLIFAFIFCCVAACKKYNPHKEDIADDFVFEMTDTSGVRANGESLVTLKLSNTKELKENLRVKFESNKGTLLEDDVPYRNNLAEVKLLVSTDTGVYSIKASVMDGDAVKVEKFLTARFTRSFSPANFNLVVSDTAGVRQDGVSIATVSFSSDVPLLEGYRVAFESSKGTLLQSDLPYPGASVSTQLTVAQEEAPYLLKGTLKKGDVKVIEKSIMFDFRRAHPDVIMMEPTASTWSLGGSVSVKTFLARNAGKVTTGETVSFSSFQLNTSSDTIPAGRIEGLLNNVSNANGQMTDIKVIADTPGMDTLRLLHIRAVGVNDTGGLVEKVVTLSYKKAG